MRPAWRVALAVTAAVVLLGVVATGLLYRAATRSPHAGSHVKTSVKSPARAVITPSTTSTSAPPPPQWEVAWASAMAWGYETVSDATVRSLVSIPVARVALRVRISNQFGKVPLAVGAASVGRSTAGAAVEAGSVRQLTFDGQASAVIPAGGRVLSDPVMMPSTGPELLAVSVFVTGLDLLSSHYPCCEARTPSYMSAPGSGNLTATDSASGFGYRAPWSRLVDAVEVERPPPPVGYEGHRGSIVVLGDSISDGFNSAARWTHLLQTRIASLPMFERSPVVNEAITANTLTGVTPSFAATGGGPPGLDRLGADALDFPGVSTLVVFLGTNDLYFGASAVSVIQGLDQVARAAHASGLRVVAMELTPRMGSEGWNVARQAELEQVDHWLRHTDVFDGLVDLYPALGDVYDGACLPTSMAPLLDSGDHLHPNASGAAVIANSVSSGVLDLPPLPAVPVGVALTPTRACN